MVEAAGIEPASEEAVTLASTCVVRGKVSSPAITANKKSRRPARKVSRVGPGHAFTAIHQSMTPTRRPWRPNRRGRAVN